MQLIKTKKDLTSLWVTHHQKTLHYQHVSVLRNKLWNLNSVDNHNYWWPGKTVERYRAFWQQENIHRPLANLSKPHGWKRSNRSWHVLCPSFVLWQCCTGGDTMAGPPDILWHQKCMSTCLTVGVCLCHVEHKMAIIIYQSSRSEIGVLAWNLQ